MNGRVWARGSSSCTTQRGAPRATRTARTTGRGKTGPNSNAKWPAPTKSSNGSSSTIFVMKNGSSCGRGRRGRYPASAPSKMNWTSWTGTSAEPATRARKPSGGANASGTSATRHATNAFAYGGSWKRLGTACATNATVGPQHTENGPARLHTAIPDHHPRTGGGHRRHHRHQRASGHGHLHPATTTAHRQGTSGLAARRLRQRGPRPPRP